MVLPGPLNFVAPAAESVPPERIKVPLLVMTEDTVRVEVDGRVRVLAGAMVNVFTLTVAGSARARPAAPWLMMSSSSVSVAEGADAAVLAPTLQLLAVDQSVLVVPIQVYPVANSRKVLPPFTHPMPKSPPSSLVEVQSLNCV